MSPKLARGAALAAAIAIVPLGRHEKEARADARERDEAIVTVEVPDDADVLVSPGDASVTRPIAYLHGMCADPREDLEAWGGIAKAHGTVIALAGDVPCEDAPGRRKWSKDPDAIDRRIGAAVSAVARARGLPLEPRSLVLIGESMGAARAEALAARFPERYTRLVLVGSPETPSPDDLRSARAVATLAGERETQDKMKAGARALDAAGIPARFWELPGATHGNYGPDGERIMGEAVGFVTGR